MGDARMSESSCFDENSSGSVVEEGKAMTYARAAQGIPFRMQQVLISWVFVVASVALILDFAALQSLVRDIGSGDGLSRFDALCNWFGVISCVNWFTGFALLAHWLHAVGATRMGLAGCYMKFAASIFFNLQPATGTMNDPILGGAAGLWWSNLVGILFFHGGNVVSCLDFYLHTPPGASKEKGWLFHGNLPITGMWVYQAATWLLVASNFLACTFDGASWAPILPVASAPVFFCQFGGSFLLLSGSLVYAVWCDALRNSVHPSLA